MSRRPGRFGALFCLTVALAGCSSAHSPGAAEPATAPALAHSAAGTVVPVGGAPEGIVYDPTTKLVAVAVRSPNRLLLLDPASLSVRRAVALPGSARHLQLAAGGGPVLVPAESANELVQVALPGGATTVTRVGRQPHDAAAVLGGDVVVGDEFGKALSVVRDGRVVRTVTGVQQPGGVIGDGTLLGVVDVHAFTLSVYHITSFKRVGTVSAGAGPTHGVLISGGRMLVADTRGNAVLIFDIDPLRRVARLALPGTPYGLADDPTSSTVWVTLTARNEVVGLDISGSTPRVIARYPTVRQPNTVAVAPGSHTLWVTGTRAGVVERISR